MAYFNANKSIYVNDSNVLLKFYESMLNTPLESQSGGGRIIPIKQEKNVDTTPQPETHIKTPTPPPVISRTPTKRKATTPKAHNTKKRKNKDVFD